MIDKRICDKGFVWNPSNCECECDKLCDVGEYLDYANCMCRKILVDKLVEEWTKNIDEVKIAGTALFEDRNECKSSCTIYVALNAIVFTSALVLALVLFTTSTWIIMKKLLQNTIMSIKHQIININGEYQRNKN